MYQPFKQTAHEVRAIIADVSTSQNHPSSAERPVPNSPSAKYIMHALHKVFIKSGRLANKSHERKSPSWPLRGESINVLGYGAEKVVYLVAGGSDQDDNVVSVYHLESMRKSPDDVIKGKKENYETYSKYFGDLVVPTSFVVLDNPWSDGSKPASIQPYIKDAQKFSSLGEARIRDFAGDDNHFAQNLGQLVNGYSQMLADGLRPDFASSNLLISGSQITIFDTGRIYPAEKVSQIINLSPNYQLIESFAASGELAV